MFEILPALNEESFRDPSRRTVWTSVEPTLGQETFYSHSDIISYLLPDPYIVDDRGVIWGNINDVIRSCSRLPPPVLVL